MSHTITSFSQYLLDMIGRNELEAAFAILQRLLKESPSYNNLILQSGRYQEIIEREHSGTANFQESIGEKNKIRRGLVFIVEELKKQVQLDPAIRSEVESFLAEHEQQFQESSPTTDPTSGTRNDLYQKQTEPAMIKLLGAQKQTYIDGKRIKGAIFGISLSTAILVPVLLLYFPEQQTLIGILGGILSVIAALVLPGIPAKKAKEAATIQEEFDTTLFGLPWNQSLVGDKLSRRVIESANRRLKDRSNIDGSPWYKDFSKLEHSQAVLNCMQENLWWDSKQKGKYSKFLMGIAILLFALGWFWGFEVLQLYHLDYLLLVFFPFSGFLIYLVQSIWRTHQFSLTGKEKEVSARILSEKYQGTPFPIPTEELRKLQDDIYKSRQSGDLVPEWFYKLLKPQFESTLEAVAEDLNQ